MTPEEIAREAASAAVVVYEAVDCFNVAVACKMLPQYHNTEQVAEAHAREMCDNLAAVILAAVERALREVPCPSPVSGERLAQIRESYAHDVAVFGEPTEPRSWQRDVGDLLAHADHLARVLRDCAEDGLLTRRQEVIDAAFRAGAQAQRDAIGLALSARLGSAGGTDPHRRGLYDAIMVARRLPLAEPPA